MKQDALFVWCPQYCSCTYEGGMVDLALCRTRVKARQILRDHRREALQHNMLRGWQVWKVVKREVI